MKYLSLIFTLIIVACSSTDNQTKRPPQLHVIKKGPVFDGPPINSSPEELVRMEILEKYRQMRLEANKHPDQYRQLIAKPPQTIIKLRNETEHETENEAEGKTSWVTPIEEQLNYPTGEPSYIQIEINQNIDYYCIKTERKDCREIAQKKYQNCRDKFPHYDDRRIISCVKISLKEG